MPNRARCWSSKKNCVRKKAISFIESQDHLVSFHFSDALQHDRNILRLHTFQTIQRGSKHCQTVLSLVSGNICRMSNFMLLCRVLVCSIAGRKPNGLNLNLLSYEIFKSTFKPCEIGLNIPHRGILHCS